MDSVFSTGDGLDDKTIVATGAANALNAALDGLIYTPDDNYNGTDTLIVTVDDLGGSGTAGEQTTSANLSLNITAVNDPPCDYLGQHVLCA